MYHAGADQSLIRDSKSDFKCLPLIFFRNWVKCVLPWPVITLKLTAITPKCFTIDYTWKHCNKTRGPLITLNTRAISPVLPKPTFCPISLFLVAIHHFRLLQPTSYNLREGFRKKNPYFLWSFAKPGGGGSARVVKKPYCFFEKVFFQRACRIILGPPKHVLHLVWSPFVIYTAIRTALKEAWEARILGKKGPNPRKKI